MAYRYADDVERLARQKLEPAVFRFLRQGARDGRSAVESIEAWDALRFLPRVLRDVTEVSTGVSLLGTRITSPFAIAPTSMQRALNPDGEIAMARAAAEAGTVMVLSSNAGSTFEEIAETGVTWWLQMYLTSDRSVSVPMLERAVEAGVSAIVLTADTPVVGTKYDLAGPTAWDLAEQDWVRVNFSPGSDDDPGREKATDLGPQDIDWLSHTTGLPVVVKGVLHSSDARRCVDAGAKAVWVSNHGGRQLDGVVTPVNVLESVVAEVAEDAEVFVDGGVRRATHAVAALAMGAQGVFLGRLPAYALAAGGAEGVLRLLSELRSELEETLQLLGVTDVASCPRDILLR